MGMLLFSAQSRLLLLLVSMAASGDAFTCAPSPRPRSVLALQVPCELIAHEPSTCANPVLPAAQPLYPYVP